MPTLQKKSLDGIISVVTTVLPPLTAEDQIDSNDLLKCYIDLLAQLPNPAGIKALMYGLNQIEHPTLRLPLSELEPKQIQRIKEALARNA